MKTVIMLALAALCLVAFLTFTGTIPAFVVPAFAATAYLFIGSHFWSQTVNDMRANFDDLDNQRMLVQLHAGSGSMILPMLTTILLWPLMVALAATLAAIADHDHGPLVRHL